MSRERSDTVPVMEPPQPDPAAMARVELSRIAGERDRFKQAWKGRETQLMEMRRELERNIEFCRTMENPTAVTAYVRCVRMIDRILAGQSAVDHDDMLEPLEASLGLSRGR